MKVKKLIELLQEIDPTGEKEVCIENADIFSIHEKHAYYDGCLSVLIRDKSKEPYFDVVGCKIIGEGSKINIQPMDFENVLDNNPAAKILYSSIHVKEQYKNVVRKIRKENIELLKKFRPAPCKSCGFKSPKYDNKKVPKNGSTSIMRMVKCRCGKHGEWCSNYDKAKKSWNQVNGG